MAHARALVLLAAATCALAAGGCGDDDATRPATRTTVPAGRLSGVPPFTITGPREVVARTGEATRVPLTITNHTRRTQSLTVKGQASGIEVQVTPADVVLGYRDSAGVTMTLRDAPATDVRVLVTVAPRGNPLQVSSTTITVTGAGPEP